LPPEFGPPPLYIVRDQLSITTQQIEFARLNLTHTVMSKRKLRRLVEEGRVSGWDDPRMPTLSGLRRRGYTPEAIRAFTDAIGVSKSNSVVELALLEHHLRQDLNLRAPRVMAVLRPLRVVITNYPEGQVEQMDAVNNPEDPDAGTRPVPFSRVSTSSRDFHGGPPRSSSAWRRGAGRLATPPSSPATRCQDRPGTSSSCAASSTRPRRRAPDGRRPKATLPGSQHRASREVRLYDHLFTPGPDNAEGRLQDAINPNSLE